MRRNVKIYMWEMEETHTIGKRVKIWGGIRTGVRPKRWTKSLSQDDSQCVCKVIVSLCPSLLPPRHRDSIQKKWRYLKVPLVPQWNLAVTMGKLLILCVPAYRRQGYLSLIWWGRAQIPHWITGPRAVVLVCASKLKSDGLVFLIEETNKSLCIFSQSNLNLNVDFEFDIKIIFHLLWLMKFTWIFKHVEINLLLHVKVLRISHFDSHF